MKHSPALTLRFRAIYNPRTEKRGHDSMKVRDHLLPGEMLVLEHPPFYLTSLRLLRDVEGQMKALPLERLTGVETVRAVRHSLMFAGTALVISGVVLWATGFLVVTPPLILAAGVGALLLGLRGKPAYYQVQARNLSAQEEAVWRLERWGFMRFVEALRERAEGGPRL